MISRTEDEAALVEKFLSWQPRLRLPLGAIEALHVQQRRVHDFQGMRPAFRFVAIEQRSVCVAVKNGRDLPGQVLCILNAQIHAKAAAWRGLMSCDSDEEYVAAAKTVRDHGGAVPEVDAKHLHRKVGDPEA